MTNRNMYGCTPCPKCGSKFRVTYKTSKLAQYTGNPMIECDDCGLAEFAVTKDEGYTWDSDGYQWAGDCRKTK